jgi:predicted DCC family thiol-disulfide oxidoreductase YuxK
MRIMESSELVLYFDGRCPLCVAEINRLGARDARQRLAFVDIAEPGFDPAPLGVGLPALNRELHARLPDGRMLTGVDSILAAHALTGRRWPVRLLRVPAVRGALAPLYRRFARNRHAVSRWLGYRIEAPCDGAACGSSSGSGRAAEPTADRPAGDAARRIAVTWMYGAAIAHLLVGIAVPWVAGAPWLDAYHRVIELHFWAGTAPDPARAQQIWWMSLMGATVQCASVWMLALVHLGNRLQKREVWGWLLAGLLIWAPQDMLFSLQAHVSGHVAIDAAALVAMVPPLVWLWRRDTK